MKVCPRCQTEKAESEFTKNRATRDGLCAYCRSCASAYNKARWAKAHPKAALSYDPIREKICTKCKCILPLEKFSKDPHRTSGRTSWCCECQRPAILAWRDRKRAQSLASKSEREKVKQARREAEWDKKRNNPPANANNLTRWRYANPEKVTAQRSRWCKAHRERKVTDEAKRRAIKAKVKIESVSYKAILTRDGYVCHICGGNVEHDQLSFDHVIPLSKDGPHAESNIKVAHRSCNSRKKDRLMGADAPEESWQ